MTPKQKAKELFNKYYLLIDINNYENTKNCALIAVDEMIAELAYVRTLDEQIDEKVDLEIDQRQDFLIEVEKEIKAL
jgi:hypothetical protein